MVIAAVKVSLIEVLAVIVEAAIVQGAGVAEQRRLLRCTICFLQCRKKRALTSLTGNGLSEPDKALRRVLKIVSQSS